MSFDSEAHKDLPLYAERAESVVGGRNKPIILRGQHGATALCTPLGHSYVCTLQGDKVSNDEPGDRRPK